MTSGFRFVRRAAIVAVASGCVASSALAQGLPQLQVELTVAGGPPLVVQLDPITIDQAAGATWVGEAAATGGAWSVSWSVELDSNPAGLPRIQAAITIDHPAPRPLDVHVVWAVPVCDLGAAASRYGASTTMMIQTPGSGGWVTSVDGATSVWRIRADDVAAQDLFDAPFVIAASGAGVAQASDHFGAPFPNWVGPALHDQLTLDLTCRLSPQTDATISSVIIMAPEGAPAAGPDTPCRADLDESGTVDIADLAALFEGWSVDWECLPSDLSEDGVVDAADLAVLLASWGSCGGT